MHRRLAFVAVLAAGLACASSKFVKTNPPPRALSPRAVTEVAVFTTTQPDRPYVEVGIVTVIGTSNPPPHRSQLIEDVRVEAAKQGCDGLILAGGSAIVAEGTCIVYK